MAYASRAMRSVIVDYVRARAADRRGGGVEPMTLTTAVEDQPFTDPQLESLDDALKSLERIDERAHRVVEMRYFGGMEIEEIAEFLADLARHGQTRLAEGARLPDARTGSCDRYERPRPASHRAV